jgi:hypothetical protein
MGGKCVEYEWEKDRILGVIRLDIDGKWMERVGSGGRWVGLWVGCWWGLGKTWVGP